LYISGFTQGLMWKQFNPDGTLLYKNWLDTVTAYSLLSNEILRRFIIFLRSYINGCKLIATVRQGSFQKEVPAEAPALQKLEMQEKKEKENTFGWKECRYIYHY
jgi:cytochrome c oxidase cbb3-type subunit I/II